MSSKAILTLCSALALWLPAVSLAAEADPLARRPASNAMPDDLPGQRLDKIAAIVNEGIVTESEVVDQMGSIVARMREQNTPLPDAEVLHKQVLDRLILQEIQMQRAAKLGLKVSDEQLNAALTDIAQRNNLQLAQLPAAVAQQGIDYRTFRDGIRKDITLQGLRQRDVISRINVTPRELEQFIERQKKTASGASEYNISHILIAVPEDASQGQVDELARRADEVYERAVGGEDFGRLAVAYSGSQTALEGGSLGWRKGPELPTFLSEVVVSMKPGDISKPMRTPSGYHLVKLNDQRTTGGGGVQDQVHVRHILMTTNELQDDATVRQRLSDIRSRVLKGEDFAAFATTLSEDPGSSVDGGDLGWHGAGTFDPKFESVVDGLQESEIAEPFQSRFGWHLVQLLGRRKFDTTEETQRNQAFQQLRQSKADEETELWLRRLRDEAYVDTDV